MRSRSPDAPPYRGLPLPRAVRNLLSHPGAFVAAVVGMIGVVALKILVVRNRPGDPGR